LAVFEEMAYDLSVLAGVAGMGAGLEETLKVFGGRMVFHGGFSSRGLTPRRRDPQA
jgi:hypothetical protein